jgi:hypothetical protein
MSEEAEAEAEAGIIHLSLLTITWLIETLFLHLEWLSIIDDHVKSSVCCCLVTMISFIETLFLHSEWINSIALLCSTNFPRKMEVALHLK